MRCWFLLCLRPLEVEPGALPACPRGEPTSIGEVVQPDRELGDWGRNTSSSPGAEFGVCDYEAEGDTNDVSEPGPGSGRPVAALRWEAVCKERMFVKHF